MTLTASEVTLRAATDADLPFLFAVYAGTRREELDAVPWDDAAKLSFLRMQFRAQHRYYRSAFPDADYDVICLGDRRVGRFYVDRRPDELRLIDVALLSEYRGRGIGTDLVGELLDEADERGVPVRAHVEEYNPARGLYRRLGFEEVGNEGVYRLMERPALDVGMIVRNGPTPFPQIGRGPVRLRRRVESGSYPVPPRLRCDI